MVTFGTRVSVRCFDRLSVFDALVSSSVGLTVCRTMVQAKCLYLIVSLFHNSLTVGIAAVVASAILVGAQPRIRCWARTRSSSSELVDTATARRQQRVEDATRVGLQFPFRPERRGRGAPSVAMKWRDAVKAAIMHLTSDVTLDAPHLGGNLECHCCHRRITGRQCR